MENKHEEAIISLLWERSEDALKQLEEQYGSLCRKIAWNILHNDLDVEECKNDSYLIIWNRVPPERPNPLRAYLCRIVRNTALKKFRDNHAGKRYQEDVLCFEELAECIPAGADVVKEMETKELTKVVEAFLDTLSKEKRTMFVKRYWMCMPVKEIATEYGITERNASVKLGRIRKKLCHFLEKEGWL